MRKTQPSYPGILDKGSYYCLTEHGHEVMKDAGTGKVLKFLLQRLGQSVTLDQLARVSQWEQPARTMHDFGQELDAWLTHYTLSRSGQGKQTTYCLSRSA